MPSPGHRARCAAPAGAGFPSQSKLVPVVVFWSRSSNGRRWLWFRRVRACQRSCPRQCGCGSRYCSRLRGFRQITVTKPTTVCSRTKDGSKVPCLIVGLDSHRCAHAFGDKTQCLADIPKFFGNLDSGLCYGRLLVGRECWFIRLLRTQLEEDKIQNEPAAILKECLADAGAVPCIALHALNNNALCLDRTPDSASRTVRPEDTGIYGTIQFFRAEGFFQRPKRTAVGEHPCAKVAVLELGETR